MNIKEVILTQLVNKIYTELGIDSFAHCLDQLHFKNYSKTIIYKFNQMGYRDEEWPDSLSGNIWAVGDSFTVGLGQPLEETWPQLVQQQINQRVINVSMNGASNNWIGRRIQFILDNFNPAAILVQWSYLHRRENKNTTLCDEDRADHFSKELELELKLLTHLSKTEQINRLAILDKLDVDDCLQNIFSISNKDNVKIIHSFIPEFFNPLVDPQTEIYNILLENNIKFFPEQKQIDFARDGFHYGVFTATKYVNEYVKKLQSID
jgi:hypothetical protein